jgi:hypothetical protein
MKKALNIVTAILSYCLFKPNLIIMTQEQIAQLAERTETALKLLEEIKRTTYNGQWTEDFNHIVIETRKAVKNSFITANTNFITLTGPDLIVAAEIRMSVKRSFDDYWEKGNSGNFIAIRY